MNSSEYQYLQNKRWRAITYDWDILSTYDNTSRLYCLTDFQAAWLLSNTEYLKWSTRWENCPCTQADMDAMKAEMEYNLMTCFDFSAWQMQTIFNNQQNALLGEYESLWDGSNPSSVNPDAPDDFFDGDGSDDRVDALCTALTLWSYSYAVEWITKASTILNIAAGVSALVDFLIPVGGNIAVRVIADLTAPLQAQVDAMSNQTALDTVICDWRNAIATDAINPTNWTSGVQGLSYTSMSDEWYIQQLFATDTQLLSNFLSFVNSLGEGYELAQIGVSVCACQDTWTSTFDFVNVDYGIVFQEDSNNNPYGYWQNGVGLKPSCGTDAAKNFWCYFILALDDCQIDSIAWEGTFTRGKETATITATQLIVKNNSVVVFDLDRDYPYYSVGVPASIDDSVSGSAQTCDELFVSLRPDYGSVTPCNGDATLTSITITGTGTKPSQLP